MTPYAGQYIPPKQKPRLDGRRGDWWPKAQEMRARRVSVGVIARILKKDDSSIRYATDEAFRSKKRLLSKRRYQRSRARQ